MNEMKVIELFAGIGSQTQALKNLGIHHKVVAISEIDKFAIKSYTALHGVPNNLGDITKIEKLPYADLWTISSPCTDISIAGKQLGMAQLSNTRSSLLWEVGRLLTIAKKEKILPKYLLLENVKNILSPKHKPHFDKWLDFLTSLGYKNVYKVVNAKHYIPQNRERVFCVSVLDDESNNKYFDFETSPIRTTQLSDYLETNVPQNYYLKYSAFESILKSKFNCTRTKVQTKDYCRTLTARDFHDPIVVPTSKLDIAIWDMLLRLTDTNKGGIPLDQLKDPVIVAQRGRNPQNPNDRTIGIPTLQRLEPNAKGICNTLTTVQKDNYLCEFAKISKVDKSSLVDDINNPSQQSLDNGVQTTYTLQQIFERLSLRKLTEREYWRLMGWTDTQINKVKQVRISKTQMYRQAGNSVIIQVLESIFRQLFCIKNDIQNNTIITNETTKVA
jgi:DNA (cytosine-5)-methyltransferase 1